MHLGMEDDPVWECIVLVRKCLNISDVSHRESFGMTTNACLVNKRVHSHFSPFDDSSLMSCIENLMAWDVIALHMQDLE